MNLAAFDCRGKGSKTTFPHTLNWMLAHFPLVKRNIRQAISSCQFLCIGDTHILNSNILYHALKRKVLPISTRTLRTMFSLGSVGGVQICGDGSIFVSRFGPGGPNLGWSKSARTPGRHIESFEVLPAIQQSSYPANSSSSRPPRSKSAGGYGPPHIRGGSVSAIFISYWI